MPPKSDLMLDSSRVYNTFLILALCALVLDRLGLCRIVVDVKITVALVSDIRYNAVIDMEDLVMPTYESPLTDQEARDLIAMLKNSMSKAITFPAGGKKKEFEVIGEKKRDVFVISVFRGTINVHKCNIGGRTKSGVMLMELHIGDTLKHKNPDNEVLTGTHLHLYTQEHGRDYAIKFNPQDESLVENCIEFMDRFNIINKPRILYQTELT